MVKSHRSSQWEGDGDQIVFKVLTKKDTYNSGFY